MKNKLYLILLINCTSLYTANSDKLSQSASEYTQQKSSHSTEIDKLHAPSLICTALTLPAIGRFIHLPTVAALKIVLEEPKRKTLAATAIIAAVSIAAHTAITIQIYKFLENEVSWKLDPKRE